jgi:hypothetical protein
MGLADFTAVRPAFARVRPALLPYSVQMCEAMAIKKMNLEESLVCVNSKTAHIECGPWMLSEVRCALKSAGLLPPVTVVSSYVVWAARLRDFDKQYMTHYFHQVPSTRVS